MVITVLEVERNNIFKLWCFSNHIGDGILMVLSTCHFVNIVMLKEGRIQDKHLLGGNYQLESLSEHEGS